MSPKNIVWLFLNVTFVLTASLSIAAYLGESGFLSRLEAIERADALSLVAFQAVSYLLAVVIWLYTLVASRVGAVGLRDACVHVSLILLAKYIPGKVWGVVARGMMMRRAGASSEKIISGTMLEQMLVLFSGGVTGLFFLLLGLELLAPALLVLMAHPLLYPVFNGAVRFGLFALHRIPGLKSRMAGDLNQYIGVGLFYKLYCLYTLQWIAIGGVFVCLALCLGVPLNVLQASYLMGSLSFAVVAGFLVLIVPGGIGIREGVLVAMLTPLLGFDTSVMLGATHRAWITVYDIVAGGIGLFLYVFHAREMKV